MNWNLMNNFLFQLYSRRDDVIEDGSDNDHITEYMCVTDFTDMLDRNHQKNYASAAYLAALDSILREESYNFEPTDLSQALNGLAFVEVIRVAIMEETRGARSNLFNILAVALEPVPGDEFCFVYRPGSLSRLFPRYSEDDDDPTSLESFDEEENGVVKNVEEDEASIIQLNQQAELLEDSSSNISVSTTSTCDDKLYSIRPVPVFVKILVDEKFASVRDLKNITRGASVAALLSLYNEDPERVKKNNPLKELPTSHLSAISDISSLLNAHVGKYHCWRKPVSLLLRSSFNWTHL